MKNPMRTLAGLVLVALVAFCAALACHAGDAPPLPAKEPPPHRREWPARKTDFLALDSLNVRGQQLAAFRKQLEEAKKIVAQEPQLVQEEARLKSDYEAAVAEITSLPGLRPELRGALQRDTEKGVWFVLEPASSSPEAPAPVGVTLNGDGIGTSDTVGHSTRKAGP